MKGSANSAHVAMVFKEAVMSTSLIVLASILALFALVMIPFMVKTDQQPTRDQHHAPAKGKKPHSKRKKDKR